MWYYTHLPMCVPKKVEDNFLKEAEIKQYLYMKEESKESLYGVLLLIANSTIDCSCHMFYLFVEIQIKYCPVIN